MLVSFGLHDHAAASDDTMLMFVGESAPVTTVASRQPEAPISAPAIVTLVNRQQISESGYQTLGELLADQPAFFVAESGRGTVPYVRGLRDAILFLYDGVPITTDVTKSFAPLDREYSLAAVDHVEIITGPGSVLWGVDAFAAVVNIVPMRGYERPGATVAVGAGSRSQVSEQLSLSHAGRDTSVFLFISGAAERFHDTTYQRDIDSEDQINNSHFAEMVGTFQYQDWLQFSGRWSDFERKFTMRDASSQLVWDGAKQTPFNYLKFSATQKYGPSHLRLSGYLQQTNYSLRDADTERRQRNRTGQLELLWDRRVMQRGLLTVGTSWRKNWVRGALIRDGFLPDFIQPDEPFFVPQIEQDNFSTQLYSLFSQFRYRYNAAEFWFGGRLEKHTEYSRALSSSIGGRLSLSENTQLKLTYGSAFRTPYSQQLSDAGTLKQEKIGTLSARLLWTPGAQHAHSLTFFHSRLKNHRSEDPYGGLSESQNRRMYGAELATQIPLHPRLTANASLSWIKSDGDSENYRVLAFSIIRPDGGREDIYEEWQQPYDQSPKWLARLGLNWQIKSETNLRLSVTGGSKIVGSYNKGSIAENYHTPTLVSLVYNQPGFLPNHDRLTLRITNLLGASYQQPDVYGPVNGPPFSISLLWQVRF